MHQIIEKASIRSILRSSAEYVCKLLHVQANEGHAVMLIARMYCISEHPAVSVACSLYPVGEDFLVLTFVEPSATRIFFDFFLLAAAFT